MISVYTPRGYVSSDRKHLSLLFFGLYKFPITRGFLVPENQNNLRMERLSVVRHRRLESVSIGIDSNKKVAEKHFVREGIPKGNHDFFSGVPLADFDYFLP